ncbi:MAG: hypothetical protein NT007_12255 [Candidatus Kapabacteria bacterium]|nr:hypothetical protein [Candidatus Kapabacteria bacterium]
MEFNPNIYSISREEYYECHPTAASLDIIYLALDSIINRMRKENGTIGTDELKVMYMRPLQAIKETINRLSHDIEIEELNNEKRSFLDRGYTDMKENTMFEYN